MRLSEPLTQPESTPAGPSQRIGLKRRSVILMIVFTIITFGFYYPIWFLRRRRALNSLDSPRKLAKWPFILVTAIFVFEFVAELSAPAPLEQRVGPNAALVLDLIQLAVGILMVVQCFFIKDILEDHLMGPEGTVPSSVLANQVKLSGLMTFFFTIYYLQYVINRDVVTPRPSAV